MAKLIQIENQADFTGGLNLRPDAFQLAPNESPDMINVDVDPRGGFRLRRGVDAYGGATAAALRNLWSYQTTTGGSALLGADGTNVVRYNAGSWTTVTAMAGTLAHAVFKDRVYVQNGDDAAKRFDTGWSAVTLGTDWNNDITTPTASGSTGDMPKGRVMAVFQGCMFVANTKESGTRHPNRIRWSHPNFPEDWYDYHYIDVDTGHDGDEIVALVPFGDRLLIFKQNSIHALFGQPPESFQVFPVTQEMGTISQRSTVVTDIGVFFYSWPDGVFLFDGKQPKWMFERLFPAVTGGDIPVGGRAGITLGWGNQRLWVSVPWLGSSTNQLAFVFDPSLGKGGAWVPYTLPLGPFVEWHPSGASPLFLAGHSTLSRVVQLDVENQPYDDFGAGAQHILSHYRTRWFDLNQPGFKKRWKRPEIVLKAGVTSNIVVDALRDYDPTDATRHFTIGTTAPAGAGVWDESTWDNAVWGRDGSIRNAVERGAPLGNARAVALKFNGPPTNSDWGVDALIMKFIPKKVRG